VLPDSPAEKAGVNAGDVILKYDGKPLSASSDLPPLVGASPIGQAARIEVLRQGKIQELQVTIGELPDDEELAAAPGRPTKATANRIGLVVEDLTAEERDQLGIREGGVMVEGVEEGPAERAGIRVGDVILMLDNHPLTDARQLKDYLDKIEPGRSVAALVQRGDGRMFFAIRIPKT
jgi:serine protease Do